MHKRIGIIFLLFLTALSPLRAVRLPGYARDRITGEQTRSFVWGGDVNVHINAPGTRALKKDKQTIIVFYALPAGNSIEWTIGKKIKSGDDWHYDIQHIGAQTRFLRHVLKDRNIIVIYLQPTCKTWQLYDDHHAEDYIPLIQTMVKDLLAPFSAFDYRVTLNGHSAGGSWILRYLQGAGTLPAWIDRIAFLDSNYNYKYDAEQYDSLFTEFLTNRDSTYLCVLAYNDSVARYQGKPVVSAEGGTWWNTRLMKQRWDKVLNFSEENSVSMITYRALNGRVGFWLKKNPEGEILHTVQVYRNGFVHSMLSGTEYENRGYRYDGEPAYLKYIK
ncbi:MAG: hypothetical protein JXR21_05855 [Candidatus Marinimicrobia bacterium]|nr:hypothetical protein [Candidatus Neomarinimicrobiota bacterium]